MVAFLVSEPSSVGSGGREFGGLGNNRAKCCALEKHEQNQRLIVLEKEQLKAIQRKISTSSSLKHCAISPIPNRGDVPCIFKQNKAHWGGLQTCKNKTCLHCHIKARKEHIKEADLALYEVEKKGGSILMVTLTCSNEGEELKLQSEALQKGLRSVFMRRGLVRALDEKGYIGRVRSQEIQINTKRFRFHPHLHLAMAFAQTLTDEEMENIASMIRTYWCESLTKQGYYVKRSQQHVNRAKSDSGKYVAKGAALEIANSIIKRGSNGSVSWVGLLFEILEADQAGKIKKRDRLISMYRHFEASLFGKRLIGISPKLQKMASEQEEEEEDDDEEEKESEVLLVPVKMYNKLRQMKVSHLVPSFLVLDSELKARFSYLCEAQRLAHSENPSLIECDPFVVDELEGLFKAWSHQDVWQQNRSLGIYETPGNKPP